MTVLAAANHVGAGEAVTFWVLGTAAVAAALGMVFSKHAVHAALLLVVNFFCLAVFYAVQDAPFLAMVQVIVYTGAIMILFLFVLMLVGRDASDSLVETLRGQRLAAGVVGLAFAGLLVLALRTAVRHVTVLGLGEANREGNVFAIARLLFTRYVFAFEITSALLITAALGAMVLAHHERTTPKLSQRDLATQRFAGRHPTPFPGPGVFARHDAVDTQAVLPDGSAAPDSTAPAIEHPLKGDR